MRKRTWRILVLAMAVSVTIAVGVLAFLYVRFGRGISSPVAPERAAYTLGVWEGQLAVFQGDNAFPQQLYEVSVAALPRVEQERLKNGIAVENEAELLRLLEDYTS